MGKAFRELKGGQRFDKLPENKQLNKEKDGLIPYNNKERFMNSKLFSINLNNSVNNKQATYKWFYPKGLIDTGAINGGPYVDEDLAIKLSKFNRKDFNIINTNDIKISVPFNGYSSSNTSIITTQC